MTVSKFASQQICQQKWEVNLLANLVTVTKSASRRRGVKLLVDLVTVSKSTSQQICQQKRGM